MLVFETALAVMVVGVLLSDRRVTTPESGFTEATAASLEVKVRSPLYIVKLSKRWMDPSSICNSANGCAFVTTVTPLKVVLTFFKPKRFIVTSLRSVEDSVR